MTNKILLTFEKPQLLLLTLFLILLNCQRSEAPGEIAAKQFSRFLENYAASTGMETDDPSDMSQAHFDKELSQIREQLRTLRAIDPLLLTGDDRIDWKFAQSLLAGRELQNEKMQPWKKNPRLYMTFTNLSTLIDGPGSTSEKIKSLETKLKIIPVQLGNGILQLDVYVPRFQELSIFMAENGRVFFEKELPPFIAKAGSEAAQLEKVADEAHAALEKFIFFLKNDLPKKPKADFAIGKDVYNAMLKNQYLLDYDADSLWNFGWDRFHATVRELEELTRKIDPAKTWQQLALELKNDYPDPHKIIEVSQEWVDKSAAHIRSHDLIPIPWKERVLVTPRAEYLRKTSYYGNFSIAKAMGSDSMFTSEMMINPFEEQWDEKKKQEYVHEHDWGVIIVTAPHETYAGHHVQGLYQLHNPRPLRRNNGISIFSEGWGLYNEQLMQETGFFATEKIHLRQLQLRLWRNARVIYDVGLHSGKMTYEEAIALMTEQVGFLQWAAQLEVDSSTASPGYFIGYFMGMTEILALREEYRKKMGAGFSLRDFHERLLKIGNMPPALMREALMM